MIVRASKGSGISGAVRYVLGEGKRDPATRKVPELQPGEQSRVAWYGGTGFGFPIDTDERLDIARRVMEWAAQGQASKTKPCKEDCFHLMLAWDKDERPARATMEAAARSVLSHLGMANARAIWACHDDTDHRHLHIVASRIDPDSGKAFRDSFDKMRLSEWALEWEKEHGGVRCEARRERDQKQAERDPEKVINALALRRETFTAFDLNRELTKAIPSRDTRRQYIAGVLDRHDIITLAAPDTGQVMRYTTRQTLAAEHLAAAAGDRLQSDSSHRLPGWAANGVLDRLRTEGRPLREDQTNAFLHATQAEGLAIIAGKAGTGKSFTMGAIAAAYEADGCTVKSLAPTNKVASALERDGLDAATLHSALGQLDRGKVEWTDKTVVMVDEAGMISTRLMARLLSHAEHAGAKVILVGDDKQLASLDRGGMFGFFAAEHGHADLNEITRQRGAEQRELATRASQYDFAAGFAALDKQGALVVVENQTDRIAKAAEIWGDRTAAAPERSMFVIAVSNAEAEAANQAIRLIRRERGELGADHSLPTSDGPKAFAAGDRILFSGSASARKDRDAGLANGNSGRVVRIDDDRLTVALDGAKPGKHLTFTVGQNREAGEFDAIRHGYAGTIYKAQGATYDAAIVIDSPTMRASTGYVALTRHRDAVTVVTARDLQPWMAASGEARDKGHDLTAMAKRWSRVDDRRAASRFEALNYRPADRGMMTPAEVRAAVGVETFEQGEGQGRAIASSPFAIPQAGLVAAPQEPADPPSGGTDGGGSTGNPWAWRMPPRPRTVADERAHLAAIGASIVEQQQEEARRTAGVTPGLRWWERLAAESAEIIQDARDWARGKWQELIAREPEREDPRRPNIER